MAMRITTTARHCELDPEDKLFAEAHLEKLSRYARDIHEIHLTVSTENYRHTAEITVKLKGREFMGRETANAVRPAITEAILRIEHQIRKLKERRLDRRRGDRTRAADAMSAPGEAAADEGEAMGGSAWED
jgi:putative sigma-54 modulation protein